jgi:transposase
VSFGVEFFEGELSDVAHFASDVKLFRLAKCSPDLNLIEQIFATLKHVLHETAASCRNWLHRPDPRCI